MGHPSIPILSLPSFHPRKVKAKLIITKWTKFYATAWRRNYLSTWIRSSARHIRVVDVCFEASQPQIAQPNCARRMPFLARFFKICTLTLVSPFSSWDVPYHTSGWNAPPPPHATAVWSVLRPLVAAQHLNTKGILQNIRSVARVQPEKNRLTLISTISRCAPLTVGLCV